MIGWRKARTIKDYLVRAKITNIETGESESARCNSELYQVCHYIEETGEFEDADGNKYDIRKGIINCNTDFTVYKFLFSSCPKQYIGSNISDRLNDCKSAFRKISKSNKAQIFNQEHFHHHFKLPMHNDMCDWSVNLIDRADNRKDIRRRESSGSINTFFPHGLNQSVKLAAYERSNNLLHLILMQLIDFALFCGIYWNTCLRTRFNEFTVPKIRFTLPYYVIILFIFIYDLFG